MATKIFYNDNRIIIDGHADTAEECKAITAMCDIMANNENFKTIVYEEGHAVFERVDGGDAMMFAMQDYVFQSKYDAEVGEDYPTVKGTIAKRLEYLDDAVGYFPVDELGSLAFQIYNLEQRIAALENKASKTLPFTADELIAKLESI